MKIETESTNGTRIDISKFFKPHTQEEIETIVITLSKGAEIIRALQAEIDEIENDCLIYRGAAYGL